MSNKYYEYCIKEYFLSYWYIIASVAPSRVRGLKQACPVSARSVDEVAPSRVRGLKQATVQETATGGDGRTLTGAWIET